MVLRAPGTTDVQLITRPGIPPEGEAPKTALVGPRVALVPARMRSMSNVITDLAAQASERELAAFGDNGKRGGVPVRNMHTILPEVWSRLGGKPKMIYGLAELGSSFGHAFVAFETPNPKTGVVEYMVPNIVGVEGERMVQWIALDEYLFGVNEFKGANRQRGVYNRPFTLIALDDDKIDTVKARAFWDELDRRNLRGEAKFVLSLPRVLNVLTAPLRWLGLSKTVYGNCARWNAESLKAAGAFTNRIGLSNWFTHNTMWPKRLALRLIQGKSRVTPDQVKVVHLPRIQHAKITATGKHDGQTYANAITWLAGKLGIELEGRKYVSFSALADAEIVVPQGTITARIESKKLPT